MKTSQLCESLTRLRTIHPNKDQEVCVAVYRPHAIGGTPVVQIEKAFAGFDWDAQKFILYPEKKITLLSPEEVAAIKFDADKFQSHSTYGLLKKHKQELTVLRDQILNLGHTPKI